MAGPWLDHVAVATDDLDRAATAYRRLGFNLTRRSSHSGDDGPWGTGNHCAMFRDGYFELIGITDPALYHDHLKAALARYTGLHLIALGTGDSDAAYTGLRSRDVPAQKPYAIARRVPYGDGGREGRFRITQMDEAWFPEADFFFCQHETPDVLWQPGLLDHPNGVTGLLGVTIASADPDDTAMRIEAVTGVADDVSADRHMFMLSRGFVEVVSQAQVAERFDGIEPAGLPWIAAVVFRTADVQALRGLADEAGLDLKDLDGGGIWVAPADADGAIVVFRH